MADPLDEDVAETPAWVKVSGTVLALLVAAFVLLHLTGNGLGGHGP